jgi:hypothetical protein
VNDTEDEFMTSYQVFKYGVLAGSSVCLLALSPGSLGPRAPLHAPSAIGIESFQADRSPTHAYHTAPLTGLDGRSATLNEVIDHYDAILELGLTDAKKKNLRRHLLSL